MILKFYKKLKRILPENKGRHNKYSNRKNTKHGILLNNLPSIYKSLLRDRLLLRSIADDDRLLNIAFHCTDMENDRKSYDKIYYIKHLDKLTTKNQIDYFNNVIKWSCSICEKEILININNKLKHQDLVCRKCVKKEVKILDEKIVKNYVDLSQFIINKINTDYAYLTKKLKKNRI